MFVSDITNFYFLDSAGPLITLGAPYFLGSLSNFQAGDAVTLEDVPAWTRFAYDPATESLNLSGGGGIVASLTISGSIVATGFIPSDEFQTAFSGLSDIGFITHLYQDGLGRTPEAGGLDYWQSMLSSGSSRTDVLLGVSQSLEAMAHNALVASAGVFTPTT